MLMHTTLNLAPQYEVPSYTTEGNCYLQDESSAFHVSSTHPFMHKFFAWGWEARN